MAAVLAEQHDEWQVTRRYMGAELITASLAIGQPDQAKEVTPALASTAASRGQREPRELVTPVDGTRPVATILQTRSVGAGTTRSATR